MSSPGTDRGGERETGSADERESKRAQRRTSTQSRSGPEGGEEGWRLFVRDLVTSVLAVMIVGAYLFAVSGVWPPLVAVESESMVPNMEVNDLVFVMEETRFPGAAAEAGSGVVTAQADGSYRKFGAPGDVIVYAPDGNTRQTPIIHRAMLWVEAGENWYDRADSDAVGAADSCDALRNCPAPHDGFITQGDNNGRYDQASGLSEPVRPEWVVGTAEFRMPGLGWIRLQSAG